MDDDEYTAETFAERERLAELFDGLSPGQWNRPSLCEGWRAREVLAHMTMPFRLTGRAFVFGMVRAGFRFNRFADRDARAAAARLDDARLTGLYRANIRHPWRPPGGGAAGALAHEVVHGLDITEALGLPGPPPERISLVLSGGGPRNLAYFGVDLAGRRLSATDADYSVGAGEELRLPARELLLVVTGRRGLPDATAAGGAGT